MNTFAFLISTGFPPKNPDLARTDVNGNIPTRVDSFGFFHRTARRIGEMNDQYQPGDFVPRSGIYFALHSEHRVVHQVTLIEGEAFPQCRICGERVSFQLWRAEAVNAVALPGILVPYCHGVVSFKGLAI